MHACLPEKLHQLEQNSDTDLHRPPFMSPQEDPPQMYSPFSSQTAVTSQSGSRMHKNPIPLSLNAYVKINDAWICILLQILLVPGLFIQIRSVLHGGQSVFSRSTSRLSTYHHLHRKPGSYSKLHDSYDKTEK